MKAYAIYVHGNQVAETGVDRLIKSSISVNNEFIVEPWPAVTPKNVHDKLYFHNIRILYYQCVWCYYLTKHLKVNLRIKLYEYQLVLLNFYIYHGLQHRMIWT